MAQYQHASRNTELGDRACFCTVCGWARRYFPGVVEAPTVCPDCDGAVVSACPECNESVLSVMAVDCDVCGAALREKITTAGVTVRRPKRLPLANQPPATPCA
jgi:hypothetical protein